MYEIRDIKENKQYTRNFEGMGDGLVLLKIERQNKNMEYNYHLFYKNGKKPPLDIAINPREYNIEYISYFLQDETIKVGHKKTIVLDENNLQIYSEEFSVDKMYMGFEKDFETYLIDNCLVILEKNADSNIRGYLLFKNNYILINNHRKVAGVMFDGLSSEELAILYNAKVIKP